MRIKKIHIQNFKSLVDFELDNPKPFCAFVGPNASGKSNIFEALEFVNYASKFGNAAIPFLGGVDSIISFNKINIENENSETQQVFYISFSDSLSIYLKTVFSDNKFQILHVSAATVKNVNIRKAIIEYVNEENVYENELEIFLDNFSRIFVGKSDLVRTNGESKVLRTDASNLSQIIGQIFQVENKREDFIEWVRILIPEFENIEVKQSNIDGSFEFFVYEKSSPNKAFPRHLLSDGTKNILALMAAVYQSSEPQFLCIEEPENGLHPQAIELLVNFFREKCETEGHHIWLNTHSPTLVRCMGIDEIILVNKIDGRTTAKQASAPKGVNIKTDDAWLTNALGGGV